MTPVRKAVFPVAGLGTRFLPATKAIPKEMLTVVDRPLIQYAVEEAREAGIEQMIFVTGRGKDALEDHFDIAYELEAVMKARGKPLGRARRHPISARRNRLGPPAGATGPRPCGLVRARDRRRRAVRGAAARRPHGRPPGCLAQMVAAYEKVGGNIVCAQDVPRERTASYGIITPGAQDGRLTEVKGLVEKPKPEDAPSTLGIVGRYILQPEIMDVLGGLGKGAGGEIQLTDGMSALIGRMPFHGLTFEGERHDCGDKTGFVIANLALALARDDVAPAVRAFLQGV